MSGKKKTVSKKVKSKTQKKKGDSPKVKLELNTRIYIRSKKGKVRFSGRIKEFKDQMLFSFSLACKKERRILKRSETSEHCKVIKQDGQGNDYWAKITRDMIRHHFGSYENFKDKARERFLELFEEVVEDKIFIPKQIEKLDGILNDPSIKRYVLTTAVAESLPHRGFLKAIKNYCKRNAAETLVLRADSNYESLDDSFYDDKDLHVLFDEVKLNNKIFVSNIKVKASQLNPVVGLDRNCKNNDSSLVIASPKQSMKVVPNQKGMNPHVLVSTGAATYPNYKGKKYGQTSRRDYMAANDHIIGALIVEIKDDEVFFFRHIQAEKSGAFVDLGVKYHPQGTVSEETTEVISLGDWHSSEKQMDVCKIFVEDISKELKVKEVVLHDFFDGESISHHTKNSVAQKSALALDGRLSLADEFHEGVKDLNWLTDNYEKVTIVPSNHNEFVDRLLDDKRWINDAENAFLSSMLFPYAVYSNFLNNHKDYKEAMKLVANKLKMSDKQLSRQVPDLINGKGPVQVGCEFYDLKASDRINWLKRDEGYKIGGVELGQHGDKGAHGSRGSAISLEKVLGKAIIGHSHTPCIHFGIYQNGTLSRLDPNYATGPSGWMHSSTVLYKNGSRQMIHVIDGEWRLKDKKKSKKKK